MLAEHHLVTGLDVENSAATLDQLCVDPEFILDRGRQTGGLRKVVSLRAVRDAHFHERSPTKRRPDAARPAATGDRRDARCGRQMGEAARDK